MFNSFDTALGSKNMRLLTLDGVKTLTGAFKIRNIESIDRMRTKRNVSCFIIRSRIVPPYHHGCTTIIDANEEHFELVSIGLYYVFTNAFIYVYSIYLNIKINATEHIVQSS